MSDRDAASMLWGWIETDVAYLGGERKGGNAGQGSESMILIVAAVSVNEAVHPLHNKITPMADLRLLAHRGRLQPRVHRLHGHWLFW